MKKTGFILIILLFLSSWVNAQPITFSGGGTGNVATDTFWDAAGDLAIGTDKSLTIGAGSQTLTIGGGSQSLSW